MVYKKVSGLSISEAQARNAAKGKAINLSKGQLSGGSVSLWMHPENARKIELARRQGRGTRINIAQGEIDHDLNQGGSFWSLLKKAGKTVGKFVKENWDQIRPLASQIVDAAVPAMAAYAGQPQLAAPARGALKTLTGVGVSGKRYAKGTPEAKAHMAALRARRGGTFRLS